MIAKEVTLLLDDLNTATVSKIVNYTKNFNSCLIIDHNGRIANCKSLISMLNLGASPPSDVVISATGLNEADELEDFMKFLGGLGVLA